MGRKLKDVASETWHTAHQVCYVGIGLVLVMVCLGHLQRELLAGRLLAGKAMEVKCGLEYILAGRVP